MDNFSVLKILSVRVTYLCMWVFKSPLATYRKCQASVCSSVLSHHSKDLEWWTLKPPRRVTALGSWTDHVIALRSRMDRVIALREISVTALFYLEDSRKIHLRGVRAHWFKDTKRRAPHHVGERERVRERSLGQEEPLEKEMAAHSSILAWKIPWTAEPGGLQSMRSQRVGQKVS